MNKMDSIFERAHFAINIASLASRGKGLASFGLKVPQDKLEFFEHFEIHGDPLERSIDTEAAPVLEYIKKHAKEYAVFLMDGSEISVLAPKSFSKSAYLLEINTISFVVEAYHHLDRMHGLKNGKWEPWYYPHIFGVLDGRNDWHELHGFIDFETNAIIGRRSSRLSTHSAPRAYQPHANKNTIVANPVETIAEKFGIPTQGIYVSEKLRQPAAKLAYKYLQETFFS
jgi:hypothetical protein